MWLDDEVVPVQVLLALRSCLVDRRALGDGVHVLLAPVVVVVNEDHVGAVLVLHPDVDLPGVNAPDRFLLREAVLCLDVPLEVAEGVGKLHTVVALEEAGAALGGGCTVCGGPQGDGSWCCSPSG